MAKYLVRRLLLMIPVLLIVTLGVAGLMRIVPGDPAEVALGIQSTPEDREKFREAYHLNDSFPVQYLDWLKGVAKGNLGTSVYSRTTVTQELKHKFPATLELVLYSIGLTVIFGTPMGIISATRRNGPVDYLIRCLSIFGLSIPSFWVGTILITMPAIWWGYLPPLQRVDFLDDPLTNLRQFFFPAVTLAIGASASILRFTRSSVLEVLRNDYVRTARAKGLRERSVLYRHVLKNAMMPVVTILGLQVGGLIGGAVIVETIFNLPGLGTLLVTSVTQRDYPVIQGMILFIALAVLLVNLAVDMSYAALNPRIRYS